jgi:hypothetical protein
MSAFHTQMNDVERLAAVERALAPEGIAVELGLSEDTARETRRPRLREVPSANESGSRWTVVYFVCRSASIQNMPPVRQRGRRVAGRSPTREEAQLWYVVVAPAGEGMNIHGTARR